MPTMSDFHWSNATYMNPSLATIPLIRPHQCDSDGGRIRGVLLYYHKITEYGIKCCMHAHLEAPRAPPSRGELYRCKTLFLDNFPIFFFYPNGTWTHPPTSKLFFYFWNCFNFAKPLSVVAIPFLYESGFWIEIISGGRLFQALMLLGRNDNV